jgi:hypothetical protein
VTLSPPGAILAGAMWNVDGGPAQGSGATVANLIATTHVLNFLGGGTAYEPPASENVVINANATTAVTGTYTALSTGTGALTVTLSPASAAGSGWYLDSSSGTVEKSGATQTGISGGPHVLNFTMAAGYITPAPQNVTILPDEKLTATGTYTKAPPFVGAAESFVGISPSGFAGLTLSLQANGRFTGKLMAYPGSYSISGSLNSAGYFAGTYGKPPVAYSITVTGSTPGTYLLTGSSNGSELSAYPDAYAKGQTVAELGKYTALFTGTDTSPAIPQGTGYATVTVSKTGAGSVTGKLADGTSFSSSSVLVAGSNGNELFIFDPNIYSKKGLLSGILQFGNPPDGAFTGTLLWQKAPHKGTYYAAGFQSVLSATGALYTYDKTNPVPFTTGTVTFSGGGLEGPVMQPFTVSDKGIVTTGTTAVKLTIKGSTGAVSGSFKPDGSTKAISFSGLLIQQPAPIAGGYFLGPVVSGTGLSGNVTLP